MVLLAHLANHLPSLTTQLGREVGYRPAMSAIGTKRTWASRGFDVAQS